MMFKSLEKIARTTAGRLGRDSWLIRTSRPAYEAALRLMYGNRGIPWNINGVEVRIDPRQRRRLTHDYDASVAEFLRSKLEPSSVCYDIGANVGVYVMQLSKWAGKVVAFEPNSTTRGILRAHVEMNQLGAKVKIEPYAVSATSGRAVFFGHEADGMSRIGTPNPLISDKVSSTEVEMITVDDYLNNGGIAPDLLFIDIEGFELQALAGAARLISQNRNLLIVCEMHPDAWKEAGFDRTSADALLNQLRLTPVPLQGQSSPMEDHATVWLKQTEKG
jgi:FkbM family methyltransferase